MWNCETKKHVLQFIGFTSEAGLEAFLTPFLIELGPFAPFVASLLAWAGRSLITSILELIPCHENITPEQVKQLMSYFTMMAQAARHRADLQKQRQDLLQPVLPATPLPTPAPIDGGSEISPIYAKVIPMAPAISKPVTITTITSKNDKGKILVPQDPYTAGRVYQTRYNHGSGMNPTWGTAGFTGIKYGTSYMLPSSRIVA